MQPIPIPAPPLDIDAIQREIQLGYINEQRHPSEPLRILNYSQQAQFDWRWNAETMQCRGLIVDDDWNVVSRPFPKFFSVEQLNGQVPVEPFEVYDKVDGSLGVLYRANGSPYIASRGSFTSDQANWATELLRTKYSHASFDPGHTYLFELIHPENRIVVDYGQRRELVLLAIIETATGREIPLDSYDSAFPVVARFDCFKHFDELLASQVDGREGFVVRFQSGQRVKIKFDEYKRLHKLLTGVSPRAIWEVLRSGDDLSGIVERVPDEFFQWVRTTESELRSAFRAIEEHARSEMRPCCSRKEFAEHFQRCKYPSVMFAMLDGKDYRDLIWRMVRPSGGVFRCGADD